MGFVPHFGTNDRSLRRLERFLTASAEGPGELPPFDALEESGLTGFASTLHGAKLRPALLAASARHAAVKGEVQRLLRAWQEAGVEALLFKGFHLAEFVYPAAGGRQYSDVDVLIEQRDALEAARVATTRGWREAWHAHRQAGPQALRSAAYRGHEVIQLAHPRLGIQVDVHRRLVHNNHNRIGRFHKQERITRMVWEEAQRVDWDGVSLRLPDPLDAVLVGLVLNRCWSPEDFELRSHDYLDFRFLVEKYGLGLNDLEKRAEELGCPKTFELFLERCDPFRRRCVLSKPTRLESQRWNLLVASERGNRYLERCWVSASAWPRELSLVLRQLPGVIRATQSVGRSGGVREATRELALPSSSNGALAAEEWQRLRRAVHRALRIVDFGTFHIGRPLVSSKRDLEAFALLAALHRRSCPATLEWTVTGGEPRPVLLLEGTALNLSGTMLARSRRAAKSDGLSDSRRIPG